MLRDISSIKIYGANFKQPTNLDIFNPHEGNKLKTAKCSLLYGRNGSGKSTIAKGFRKIAGEDLPAIGQTSILDKDGVSISVSENEKKHIFVFDEEYVDKNIKLHEDNLDTIVMLGEQVDLDEQIKAAEEVCKAVKNSLEYQRTVYNEYCDAQNPKSYKYYLLKLRWALQGDGNWAGRDKIIRDGRQNTGVRDDTYKQFLNISPAKTKNELILDFENAKQRLNTAKAGAAVIDAIVPSIPEKYYNYNENELQILLSAKIEQPELSEREKYLLQLTKMKGSHVLSERLGVLGQAETTFCPYCFQEITPTYKEDLIHSIKKILNETVENHQKALQDKIWGEMQIDFFPFKELKSYSDCIDLVKQVDESIRANNDLLQRKIDDPYRPIEEAVAPIQPLIYQLSVSISNMEKERTDHNKIAKNTKPIIEELTRINSEIAHHDIVDLASQFDKQHKEYQIEEKRYNELLAEFKLKEKNLQALCAQKNSVTVALDVMNNYMKYIFFEEDRLRIEYSNGAYKLLSHGQSVKPRDVSVGERNIIGLCYFFTSILSGKEEKSGYNEEYLIVIDDPISSYDAENKIGILSFLKYKISIFLEGNEGTKALILTHDLMTFYDFHKILEEIMEKCKQKGYANPPKFNAFELRDESISKFQYKNRQEYTELIRMVYHYGQNQADEQSVVIGNIMRQVLETFSTFEYKKGIEKVSTDDDILSLLGCKELETYFRNLMYRLVLHGGSHKEEQVKSMSDMNFFSLISEKEKKRTAKDILCFICCLNKPHLLAHLKDIDPNAETKLDAWLQDIRARSVVV